MRQLIAVLALAASGCASSPPPAAAPSVPEAATPEDGAGGGDGADPVAQDGGATPFVVPRYERVNLDDLGIAVYLPKGFPSLEASRSEDGAEVRSGELTLGGFTYTCIAVRFKERMDVDPSELEEVLIGYLDFLKGPFDIDEAVGYGRGHTLESEPAARGVIDFWKAVDESELAVKGWITPTHIVVKAISGPGEYPSYNAQKMYLDGVRFSLAP